MPRKSSPQPTEVELQILNVIWQLGPTTVRRVHQQMSRARDTGYSTTLKMMQVMTQKGLLLKDEGQRPQVYKPAITQKAARTSLLDDLVQRAFGGSADKLILHAVQSGSVSLDELSQIKQLIDKLERGARP